MIVKVGIGQDSHEFDYSATNKPLIIGGIPIEFEYGLRGNSDGDPVLHAICHAISSISGVPIIGEYSDRLCSEHGVTDSAVYLTHALRTLGDNRIQHLAISIECQRPRIMPHHDRMRTRIADLLGVKPAAVGITATSGEGLTSFGKGLGVQTFAILTAAQFS